MITSSLAAASLCLAVGLFYLLKRFYSQKNIFNHMKKRRIYRRF